MKYTSYLLMVASLCAIIKWTSAENNCEAAAKCSTCLRAAGNCKWCADEDYDKEDVRRPRCNTLEELNENKCKNIQIKDGTSSQTDNDFGEEIQLSPKKVELTLRPGQTQSFNLSVKPAENYPVRLYYLMDMSLSMEDDLENLKDLGTKIAKEISNITSNFQLAFGTFVDKSVTPYVWLTQEKPCSTCVPTFGYQHVFDFNEDAKMFEDAVRRQQISGNLDSPEGGFDALMQVAVCGDKIWPKEEYSRKIVLYVTDATPHIAGDGKLGGITVPNDGQCHLVENNEKKIKYYSKTNDMDYPSISFLRKKLQENEIIPIIASIKMLERIYGEIAEQWEVLGTEFGTLERDSSNIVTLIKDNYQKISSTIRLHDNSRENMEVKYKVTGGCDTGRDDECSNVRINQKVDFAVSVTATTCPDDHKNGETFSVTIPGFGHVEVDVKYICDCECDLGVGDLDSPKCNRTGTFKCGICYCDEGRFGKQCQCSEDVQEDDTLCIRLNSTDTEVCSGSGSCICGKCVCNVRTNHHEIISGTYCQCNNFGCDRHNGKICGGPEQGICKCGKCECKDPYLGDNCGEKDCILGELECMGSNGEQCNGNGKCDCGNCVCDYGYDGKHCEKCRDCAKRCQIEEKCVLCHEPYNKGDKSFCDTCNLQIELVNKTEGEGRKCPARFNATCNVWFNVSSESDIIYLHKDLDCTNVQAVDPVILPIVLGIIGGIVLLGLIALLIWKLMVTLFDKIEWEKFQNEIAEAPKSDQNPLYREPQQKFNNPLYVGAQA